MVRQVRRFRPDVVHFHDPELLLLAPLLRWLAPTVIYDVHESLPDLVLDRAWIPGPLRRAVSSVCAVLEPLLARFCTALVLVDGRWGTRFGSFTFAVAEPCEGDFNGNGEVEVADLEVFAVDRKG